MGLSLYPHQEEGVSWIVDGPLSLLLCDEQGLGKTIQALEAARRFGFPILAVTTPASQDVWARECARWYPELVPWQCGKAEHLRWPARGELVAVTYPHLSLAQSAESSVSIPKRRTPEERSLMGARARGCGRLLRGPKQPTMLVLDEVHWAKGNSARAVLCSSLRDLAVRSGGGALGLTGTPMRTSPMDLWGILDVMGLCEDVFPETPPREDDPEDEGVSSFQHFVDHFGGRLTEWRSAPEERRHLLKSHGLAKLTPRQAGFLDDKARSGAQAAALAGVTTGLVTEWRSLSARLERRKSKRAGKRWDWPKHPPGGSAMRRLAPFVLRREKKDVLPDLPPKTYRVRWVKTSADLTVAGDLDKVAKMLSERSGIERPEQLTDPGQVAGLLKILEQEHLFSLLREVARAKFDAVLDLVEEAEAANERLVVYSYFKTGLGVGRKGEPNHPDVLTKRRGWASIVGGKSGAAEKRRRDRAVKSFVEGRSSARCFALTSAAAEGITLVPNEGVDPCTRFVRVSAGLDAAGEDQVEDRLHRIGQGFPVLVEDLVLTHPAEVWLYNLLATKAVRTRESLSLDNLG